MLVEPAFRNHPDYAYTYGPTIGRLSDRAGFAPDPEQQLVLTEGIFARTASDGVAAFEVAVIGARQNIKTGLFKQAALGWMFLTFEELVVWSSHRFKTTMEAYVDLVGIISANEWMMEQVATMTKGSSNVAIEMKDGRRLTFEARTGTGTRGMSAPKLILDEAFALEPAHIGTLMPLMSKYGDQGQILYGSSAGMAKSATLRSIRDRGRAGGDPGLAYFEWADLGDGACARGDECSHHYSVEGCRLDEEWRWQRANPQLGRRITVDYVRKERRSMSPAEFARERLGWWDEPDGTNDPLIPDAAWKQLTDIESQIVTDPVFVLDAAPLSTWAVILAAGENAAGRVHVEITSREGRMDYRPGVLWVVPRVRQMTLTAGLETLHIVKGSAAEALIPALEREWTDDDGVTHPGVAVEVMSWADYLPACQGFVTAVAGEDVAHIGQPELAGAVTSGVKGNQPDKGLWGWGRVAPTVDIAPLVAATAGYRLVANREDQYDVLDSIL